MSIKSLAKNMLTKRENKKYERLLAKRRMTYEQWCEGQTFFSPETSGEESPFVLVCSEGGTPDKGADALLGAYFKGHPEVQVLYGDEDVWETPPGGSRHSPWFKPDWSPDLFDNLFYFGGLTAVRRRLYEQAAALCGEPVDERTFVKTCVELAGGYEKGCRSIAHIPQVLFHWESREAMLECQKEPDTAGKKDALHGADIAGITDEKPFVSAVICSKDHPQLLGRCLKALERAGTGTKLEVIVVDNGSSPENRRYLEQMLSEHTYLYQPMEFDFSSMCNLGAERARGKFLLFLNDDVELCGEDCLGQMALSAGKPYVGAVGIKLYYPDSVRIQHAGIVNLPMGPVHKLQFLEDTQDYYFGWNKRTVNVLAVTAACLMVEREKFCLAGGFSPRLKVAFNDVELGFKLWELGYFNVCRNDLYAYHHESLSRGDDETKEKLNRLLKERALLYEMHPALLGEDPFYSVHLSRQGLDTRIRPAFETAGNKLQEERGTAKRARLGGFREDSCLLFRVESCEQGILQGYGVVLGDDNSCYERYLLFEDQKGALFFQKTKGQYRPDLVENMPDQNRVGLCGFWLKVSEENLPRGIYRVGMAAKNTVTGIKLLWWSLRTIEIGEGGENR